jgi:hypothetical protein
VTSGDLGAPAFGWVVAIGAFSGAGSLLVFRRLTNGEHLRRTANRIFAHLLEIRLFADEPILVLRAQWDLIIENGRLLLLLARPAVMLLVPFVLLLTIMDLFFGRVPLRAGDTALVTVQLAGARTPVLLRAPNGITVEDPSLFAPSDRQLVWQLSVVHSLKGELRISDGAATILKTITAGDRFSFLSPQRGRSLWRSLRHPGELPFSSTTIDSIKIGYPPATIFHLHWLWWFGLSSLVGAGVCAFAL